MASGPGRREARLASWDFDGADGWSERAKGQSGSREQRRDSQGVSHSGERRVSEFQMGESGVLKFGVSERQGGKLPVVAGGKAAALMKACPGGAGRVKLDLSGTWKGRRVRPVVKQPRRVGIKRIFPISIRLVFHLPSNVSLPFSNS